MPKLRSIGSFVYIQDENLCKDSFSHYPSTRIFKITSAAISSGKSYVWLNSASQGIYTIEVKTATKTQLNNHFKLYPNDKPITIDPVHFLEKKIQTLIEELNNLNTQAEAANNNQTYLRSKYIWKMKLLKQAENKLTIIFNKTRNKY